MSFYLKKPGKSQFKINNVTKKAGKKSVHNFVLNHVGLRRDRGRFSVVEDGGMARGVFIGQKALFSNQIECRAHTAFARRLVVQNRLDHILKIRNQTRSQIITAFIGHFINRGNIFDQCHTKAFRNSLRRKSYQFLDIFFWGKTYVIHTRLQENFRKITKSFP